MSQSVSSTAYGVRSRALGRTVLVPESVLTCRTHPHQAPHEHPRLDLRTDRRRHLSMIIQMGFRRRKSAPRSRLLRGAVAPCLICCLVYYVGVFLSYFCSEFLLSDFRCLFFVAPMHDQFPVRQHGPRWSRGAALTACGSQQSESS